MMIGSISNSNAQYPMPGGAAMTQAKEGVSGRQADGAPGVGGDNKVKGGYKSSPAQCQTCKERKYQDGSNETDVSFKSPGHISPQSSGPAVMAHEQQHVSNAYQKAAKIDGKVIACNVSLQTAVCPECGTVYVSGGTTRTSIAYPDEGNPYQKDKKAQDAIRFTGANADFVA